MKATTDQLDVLKSNHTEYEDKIKHLESELQQALSAEANANSSIEQLEGLKTQAQENDVNVEKLKKELENALAELKETREKHHTSIAELVSKHGEEKSQVRSELENNYTLKIQQLETDLEEAKSAALNVGSSSSEEIEQLKKTHEQALNEIKEQHEKNLQTALSEQETNSKNEKATLEEAHHKALTELQEKHDELMQETKEQMTNLQNSDIEARLAEERKIVREELENAWNEEKEKLASVVKERDELNVKVEELEKLRKEQDERYQSEKQVGHITF